MPFQYTFRADDITTWDVTTRDLVENRDRELELSLINLNGANPIGAITMWAGSIASIPANYIWCDGSSYPTSTYPELFAAIIGFFAIIASNKTRPNPSYLLGKMNRSIFDKNSLMYSVLPNQ